MCKSINIVLFKVKPLPLISLNRSFSWYIFPQKACPHGDLEQLLPHHMCDIKSDQEASPSLEKLIMKNNNNNNALIWKR